MIDTRIDKQRKESLKEYLQERVDICNAPFGAQADMIFLNGCIQALAFAGIDVDLITDDDGGEIVRVWCDEWEDEEDD